MKIPEDHNTRAEAMWRIISQRVYFRGKNVIDLGCGTGDFLWRAYVAGAQVVFGVDKGAVPEYIERMYPSEDYPFDGLHFMEVDLEYHIGKRTWLTTYHDVALCFSVLPYLDDIPATLNWMAQSFELCLIEAQYAPEPFNVGVLSDKGMAQLLVNNGFTDVEPLGTTTVEDRFDDDGNAIKRTIWMCK